MWVAEKQDAALFFLSLVANLHLSVNQGILGSLGLHWILGMVLKAAEVSK